MPSCDLPESVPCPINLLVFQHPHPACCFSLLPYASCLLLQPLPSSKADNELQAHHSWKKLARKNLSMWMSCFLCFLSLAFLISTWLCSHIWKNWWWGSMKDRELLAHEEECWENWVNLFWLWLVIRCCSAGIWEAGPQGRNSLWVQRMTTVEKVPYGSCAMIGYLVKIYPEEIKRFY